MLSTPGGGSITQRFRDAATLLQRRRAVERTLLSAGWVTAPPPRVASALPYFVVSFTTRPYSSE